MAKSGIDGKKNPAFAKTPPQFENKESKYLAQLFSPAVASTRMTVFKYTISRPE